uniref:DNA-directed RNA polymerase subunit n=1 Tax=Chlorodesmis fastigiata TaxID=189431 RepID=A0A2P0QIU2_CHLFS|nr:RNA polymerase b-subunit [Chlorodesmis fastigiata]ARO74159.1 RNA polymerase b-subunit [Chlorodesmis fastigiata]
MKFKGIRLRLATSKIIRKWARRQLSNKKKISGQILNSKTLNYQTLKPERDGLFCERIFGPVNDYVCACGLRSKHGRKFCPECEVEYISSRVRRYRLGYIQFISAVAHIWFFRENYFPLFLNLPKTKIESLLYCTQNIPRTIFPKEMKPTPIPSSLKFLKSLQSSPPPSSKEQTILLRTLPSSDLLNLNLKFSKFWSFEKKVKHPIEKKIYLFFNLQTQQNIQTKQIRMDKSIWKNGGLKDSALFFGFSAISKMFSWEIIDDWLSFNCFFIQFPQKKDRLNKFYPGPIGLVDLWEFKSGLSCFAGAQLIRTWFTQLTQHHFSDGKLLEIQIQLDLLELEYFISPMNTELFFYKLQLNRRLKYLKSFRSNQLTPASMVLSVFPVLPPGLRPILKLNETIAASDVNQLYQSVISRNKRLSYLVLNHNLNCLNSAVLQYAQRLLQESVDCLIDNNSDKNNNVEKVEKRPLKSLSDLFKGKTGRFRQNLLGKRVDYSGRSVIVVGPSLKIYECGLPKDIAFELFQPFLIRKLMFKKQVKTIRLAKQLLSKKTKFVWNLLKNVVQRHPILLNRAPTLHRLSIQTFQPKLIDGKAILLHPLVCAAFNADFDGDQMGVHIPLCCKARAEAWKINWSQNNLFSIATHRPTCSPSQDMILGSSFLTIRNTSKICTEKISFEFLNNLLFQKPFFSKTSKKIFSKQIRDILLSNIPLIFLSRNFPHRSINEQDFVWCSLNPYISGYETEKKKVQKLIEIRLNSDGNFQKFRHELCQQYHFSGAEMLRKIRTTYGRLKFYQNLV